MRIALIVALVIISMVLIVSVLLQPSKTSGLSGFIGGGSTDTYYSKNKARTYEAVMARLTVICSILFAAVVIALNLVE
ncbi:preprotein translocase subunit SecG [Clostridium sp. SYSU_GA19001]|uniref:preprotein translocase subunit SecG n=1 Tax=Clostridium caldaquaticum TaxID=2940653 RepID=UPI002076DC90|nr:preprotein translocase subunit SecG [Clostridium caldaquaticum]MCM8711811.1 preprotein translocase subunit SecG [Clostridium caldaquaticum]